MKLIHMMNNNFDIVVIVEDGRKPPSARKLTEEEEKFFANWTGGMLAIVNSVDEALELLKRCE